MPVKKGRCMTPHSGLTSVQFETVMAALNGNSHNLLSKAATGHSEKAGLGSKEVVITLVNKKDRKKEKITVLRVHTD